MITCIIFIVEIIYSKSLNFLQVLKKSGKSRIMIIHVLLKLDMCIECQQFEARELAKTQAQVLVARQFPYESLQVQQHLVNYYQDLYLVTKGKTDSKSRPKLGIRRLRIVWLAGDVSLLFLGGNILLFSYPPC